MTAVMIGITGRAQNEGEVIHATYDCIVDRPDLLGGVGEITFPRRTGRGDGARHADSADRGDEG